MLPVHVKLHYAKPVFVLSRLAQRSVMYGLDRLHRGVNRYEMCYYHAKTRMNKLMAPLLFCTYLGTSN